MYFLYKEVIQSHEIYLEKHPQVKMNQLPSHSMSEKKSQSSNDEDLKWG